MSNPPSSLALKIILITILVLSVITGITVNQVDKPMEAIHMLDLAASPYGYTWSLLLVVVPFLVLLYWYIFYPNNHRAHWRCLLQVIVMLTVAWTLLDIFFALTIFYFPNCGATLGPPGWRIPGYIPGTGFVWAIPIEEVAFYLFSAFSLVMIYIWFSEVWFGKYALSESDHRNKGENVIPIVEIDPIIFVIGVVLVVIGIILQMLFGHVPPMPVPVPPMIDPSCQMPQPFGFTTGKVFPVYFTLLVILIVLPSVFFYRKMKCFINTGALHMTILLGTLISLIWEVTLAMPYGWWGYQPDYMLGFYIAPWYNLPIESVLLWLAAGWSTIFLYEFVRLKCVTGRSLFSLMFGGHDGGIEVEPGSIEIGNDPSTKQVE